MARSIAPTFPKSKSLVHLLCIKALIGLSKLHHERGEFSSAATAIDDAVKIYNSNNFFDKVLLADCLSMQAKICITKGNYSKAIMLYDKALGSRKLELGDCHSSVAKAKVQLGLLALIKCDISNALQLVDEGMAIWKVIFLDEDHPANASSYYAKAKIFQFQGKYNEASLLMSKAQNAYRRGLPPNHHLIAQCMFGLGEATRDMGYPREAHIYFENSLNMRHVCFAPVVDGNQYKHPCIAESTFGLAVNFEARGILFEAIPLYEQAQQFFKDMLLTIGVGLHKDLEICSLCLARVYCVMGRVEDAKPLLSSSGKMLCKILGSNHINVANGILALGQLSAFRGKFNDATMLFDRCLKMKKLVLGEEHPEIADVLHAISENLRGPGYFQEASENSSKALEMRMRIFHNSSPAVAYSLHNRAQIHRDSGELAAAENIYLQSLAIFKSCLGEKSGPYSIVLGDLGECLRMQRKFPQAEETLSQAVLLRKELFGDFHPYLGDSMRSIAQLLLDQNKPEEARALLKEGVLPIHKKVLGSKHPSTLFTAGLIGVCIKEMRNRPIHAVSAATLGEIVVVSSSSSDLLVNGQEAIDEALDVFDLYKQGPFAENQPWVLRLASFMQGTTRSPSANATVQDENEVMSPPVSPLTDLVGEAFTHNAQGNWIE